MFGPMTVWPIVQLERDSELLTSVSALLQATDQPQIAHWIEFPASLLLFLLVPGDPESGALYFLDRRLGTWYAVDFKDEQFGGYSDGQFQRLLRECNFLDLMECPGLGRGGLEWRVEPGKRPEARV